MTLWQCRDGTGPPSRRNINIAWSLFCAAALLLSSCAAAGDLFQDYLQAADSACKSYRHDQIRYAQCHSDQMGRIAALSENIEKNTISAGRLNQARLACRAEKYKGVVEYDACLRTQLHLPRD